MVKDEDFAKRYFDLLQKSIEDVSKKFDENTKLTQQALYEAKEAHNHAKAAHDQGKLTNGRVDKLWKKVFPDVPVIPKHQLPSFFQDPVIKKILYYFFGAIFFAIMLFATSKGIDVSNLP